MRLVYMALAYLCVGLGVVGIFLPVLPTTPFLLLALWAGSKGSRRFKWWLLRHPKFGPGLRLWYREGSIPLKAKIMAVLFISASWCILFFKGTSANLLIVLSLILLGSASFIISRPTAK
ncbi:YbaN family protein [uncultured Pseudoteredinibacter sp.]|uniref:YbaN family protein n=1 Tax=uncultured Pseudoteredinibacter sp. TaxID=1641701 RepID=UPI00260E7815|nr:YbaN family protein [uncultured Pseudoteredinibacter sp.]